MFASMDNNALHPRKVQIPLGFQILQGHMETSKLKGRNEICKFRYSQVSYIHNFASHHRKQISIGKTWQFVSGISNPALIIAHHHQ